MQTNINVLLVEDNLIAQTVAKMILTDLGCKVQVAADGEQALEMFKANKYHFIFMDLGLPGINGLEATKEIRKLEMHLPGVPIVALTANYDSSSSAICFAAGMNDFILKPLSKEKASAILTKILSEANLNA